MVETLLPVSAPIALAYYLSCAVTGFAAHFWPKRGGQVTSARLNVSHGARGSVNYSPRVTYTYEAGGKVYSGNRVTFGPFGDRAFATTALRRAAHDAVEKYQVGRAVEVHYAPWMPSQAVLEPGVTAQTVLWVIFLAFVFVATLLFL
jgi:hypothetical protein